MVDSMSSPATRCPWCSALLTDESSDTCPSCNATLAAAPGAEGDIKGVTTLDTDAIIRARSEIVRPKGNRLISFITGEVPVDVPDPASAESLAPPDNAVRREMLRLQLEAERADMQAETVALKSDELTRLGIHLSQLSDPEAAEDDDAPDAEATDATETEAVAGGDASAAEAADQDPESGAQA
jgi:hypothetical protein